MKRFINDNLPAIIVIFIIFVAISSMAILLDAAFKEDEERHYGRQTYEYWCKLEKRSDITYEEWKRLKIAGLLQPQK